MILNDEQRNLRWQLEVVSYRGLHAIEFFHAVTGRGDNFWKFTQNCYGEAACLNWCHIFNNWNNDSTHYRNLFGDGKLSDLDSSFAFDSVQQRLWKVAHLDKSTYPLFRQKVIDLRNKYIAHRDYEIGTINFPDTNIIRAMFLEMRLILEETVIQELAKNPNDKDLKGLLAYYSDHQNSSVINLLQESVRKNGPCP